MSDNALNSPGLMDPSTEFGGMMQHAMKIKGAQMEQDRKRFETWPTFLQNTMWLQNEEALELRKVPPGERCAGAEKLKEQGNEHFRNQRYASAVECYEAAVGTFRYAKQLDPDWKKKGIKDETIELIDERGEGEDRKAIDAILVSCYNNLAASFLARAGSGHPEPGGSIEGDYRLCVQASTFGIDISASCKALYRRARALSEPMTADDAAIDAAISDLKEAAKLEPEDKAVRTLLAKLKRGRADAKARETSAFSGLFAKGELYDADSLAAMAARDEAQRKANEPKDKARTPEDCEREQREAQAAVDHLRERGRHADADSLEKKLAAHKEQLAEYKQKVAEEDAHAKRHDPRLINFDHPTAEQIADAQKHGVDLHDPLVVEELKKVQAEKEFGGEEEEDEGEEEELVRRSSSGASKSAARLTGARRQAGENLEGSTATFGGLQPRTRAMIFAFALAVGLYRVWGVFRAGIGAGSRDVPAGASFTDEL
jgi:hypothetical protein